MRITIPITSCSSVVLHLNESLYLPFESNHVLLINKLIEVQENSLAPLLFTIVTLLVSGGTTRGKTSHRTRFFACEDHQQSQIHPLDL